MIDNIGSDDGAALQNLVSLNTYQWTRATVESGGSVTVNIDGLIDGSYKVYLVDGAGNFSSAATSDITVSGSSVTAGSSSTYEYDVDFTSIDLDGDGTADYSDTTATAGLSSTEDSAVKFTLDLDSVSVGDDIELFADGTLVYAHVVTSADVATGNITTTEVDLASADSTANDAGIHPAADTVALEIKVKHNGVYVEDHQDVTWDYQW